MNVNKIGITAKRLDNFISKKLGIIFKIEKLKEKPEQIENEELNFNTSSKDLKRALSEAEISRSQAIEHMCRIQNR